MNTDSRLHLFFEGGKGRKPPQRAEIINQLSEAFDKGTRRRQIECPVAGIVLGIRGGPELVEPTPRVPHASYADAPHSA